MSNPSSRYALPGFGLPLNFTPEGEFTTEKYLLKSGRKSTSVALQAGSEWGGERLGAPMFPTALDPKRWLRLTPVREFTMMRLMNQLTDKPGWDTKIFNETIVDKWKAEALQAPGVDVTERMFTYCIDELRYKSKIYQETGTVVAYDGDVVKSDIVIPTSLKDALRTAAKPLEDIPEVDRDWHPGSNEMVLDLVHPSLFPLVYGRTRILKDGTIDLDDCVKRCGNGEIPSVPPYEEAQFSMSNLSYVENPYSRKFQWLPCEVEFEGVNPKITSYINNLHPQVHKQLYQVIEQIIGLTIPLWNHTLTPLTKGCQSKLRIVYSKCKYDPDPEQFPEEEKPQILPEESGDDFLNRRERWEEDVRKVVRPEPEEFVNPPHGLKTIDLRQDFGMGGLQVIVKLANIHLTPEKPEYAGGTWHVEGQLNEHICATALYYYDSSNITESLLSFRQRSEVSDADNVSYIHTLQRHEWLPEVFGCEQGGFPVQNIGDVVTKEGRLITFPNIFQHRVSPFGLIDKTKPGHRKILALFLVDPHMKIISTANVPCQQKEWWEQELRLRGIFEKLPNELVKEIMDNVKEFPIGMDQAKQLRIKLMKETKVFVQDHDEEFHSEAFSLCEH